MLLCKLPLPPVFNQHFQWAKYETTKHHHTNQGPKPKAGTLGSTCTTDPEPTIQNWAPVWSNTPLGEAGTHRCPSPPEEDAKPSAAGKAAYNSMLGAEISVWASSPGLTITQSVVQQTAERWGESPCSWTAINSGNPKELLNRLQLSFFSAVIKRANSTHTD